MKPIYGNASFNDGPLTVNPAKMVSTVLTGVIFFLIMIIGSSEAVAASESDRQEQVQDGRVTGGVENARRAEELEHGNTFVEASKLIGQDVADNQKNKLGKVTDFAINIKTGHISYVVMSTGGFLGLGDKLIALPPQSFTLNPVQETALGFTGDKRVLILNISPQIIKQSPTLKNDNWETLVDQQALQNMYQRAGVRVPTDVDNSQKLTKATAIIGSEVATNQNEDVGKIKDLAVDIQSGRVPYAVLSIGGFAGINDKVIAVPTKTLAVGDKKDKLRISSTQDQLKNMPAIDQNNWKESLENSAVGAPQEPVPQTMERQGK